LDGRVTCLRDTGGLDGVTDLVLEHARSTPKVMRRYLRVLSQGTCRCGRTVMSTVRVVSGHWSVVTRLPIAGKLRATVRGGFRRGRRAGAANNSGRLVKRTAKVSLSECLSLLGTSGRAVRSAITSTSTCGVKASRRQSVECESECECECECEDQARSRPKQLHRIFRFAEAAPCFRLILPLYSSADVLSPIAPGALHCHLPHLAAF